MRLWTRKRNCIFRQFGSISRLLDLAFVDKHIISEAFTPIMPIFEKSFHHSPLIIELSSQFYQPFHPINNEYYDFKKADFVALNSFLRTFDWVLEFQDKNLQNMYVSFLKIIKVGLNNFVPKNILLVILTHLGIIKN